MMASSEWHVRGAGIEDAGALALVGAATFLETFAGILDGPAIVAHCERVHVQPAYGAAIKGGAKAWLAGTGTGDAPIGYALAAAPELPGAEADDWELKRIYALSRFHGCGLGGALLEAVIGAATGYERLLLGVYVGNARAIAFYRKQGFEPMAERRFDVGGTLYDDVVLARRLTN